MPNDFLTDCKRTAISAPNWDQGQECRQDIRSTKRLH